MKLALAFVGGIAIATFGYLWYLADNTAEILAFLKSREAVVGKVTYLPEK